MRKSTLAIYSIVGLIISIYFFVRLDISFQVILYAISRLFNGTIKYDEARLGTLVLTSSLVGIGVVLSIYSGLILKNKKLNSKCDFLSLTIVPFIYAIIFSLVKTLIGFPEDKDVITSKMIDGIGHISFFFYVIGLIAILVWSLYLGIKLKKLKSK